MKTKLKKLNLGYLALVPFLTVVFLYEILPLIELAVSSLTSGSTGSFTLNNFIKVFTTPLYAVCFKQRDSWNPL